MKYRTFIRPSILALASILTCAVAAHAAFKQVEPGKSMFEAVGPAGLKIEGSGDGVTVDEVNGTLVFKASVMHLKTGMDLRDDHLRDAIHAKEHPEAKFEVARSSLQIPEDQKESAGGGVGTFTLNGVSHKDQKFTYKAKRTGSHFQVFGETTINLDDYKIKQPCYLGVCVDKTIKVKIKVKLHD